jgi:tRNA G37 N-methylase Trm5
MEFQLPIVKFLDIHDLANLIERFPQCSFSCVTERQDDHNKDDNMMTIITTTPHDSCSSGSNMKHDIDPYHHRNSRIRETRQTIFIKRLNQLWPDEDLSGIVSLAKHYTIYDDMILLPNDFFPNQHLWDRVGIHELDLICDLWKVKRVARKDRIHSDAYRTPRTSLLRGIDGWVRIKENGIIYSWDVTRCMYSQGNISEKLRMARLNVEREVIVDLCAGIGYFTLPLLVHGRARKVYACDWNPNALEALRRNLKWNRIGEDRYVLIEGDHRDCPLEDIADRVLLGLLPSSEQAWPGAVKCLKTQTGGLLHIHGNIQVGEEDGWKAHVIQTIQTLLSTIKKSPIWHVYIEHLECVKSYAPKIFHYVADVQCRPIQMTTTTS